MDELIERFGRQVAPFRPLWRSMDITCFAVRCSESWLNLATRVILSERLPKGPNPLAKTQDFVAYSVGAPQSEFGFVLHSVVVDGFVPLQTEDGSIKAYLTRHAAQLSVIGETRISPYGPIKLTRRDSVVEYGTQRPAFVLSVYAERIHDIVGSEFLDRVDSLLRFKEPAYDGLAALAAHYLPGVRLVDPNQTVVQIVAPFPFDLETAEAGDVVVRSRRVAFEQAFMRCFFKPTGQSASLRLSSTGTVEDEDESGLARWQSKLPWPPGSEQAKVVLFYGDSEVGSLEKIPRWPAAANSRIAVDSFFDPEYKKLREAILEGKSRDSLPLESAVVRLLNLLGAPLVWYGKGATHSRADMAGEIVVDGRRVVVLGECTRERPTKKFSGLAEQARELSVFLQKEAEVLPIVVTRAITTPSEREQAAEHGISLVGRTELEHLLGLLGSGTTPEALLEYLGSLKSMTFQFGISHPRFGR